MSWGCPHEEKGECKRLKKKCEPLQKGCVLEGKFKFVEAVPEVQEKKPQERRK